MSALHCLGSADVNHGKPALNLFQSYEKTHDAWWFTYKITALQIFYREIYIIYAYTYFTYYINTNMLNIKYI